MKTTLLSHEMADLQWPAALRHRLNWKTLSLESRNYLIETLQRRKYFCSSRLSLLPVWLTDYKSEKAMQYVRTHTLLPPLQLALLRTSPFISNQNFSTFMQRHDYQVSYYGGAGSFEVRGVKESSLVKGIKSNLQATKLSDSIIPGIVNISMHTSRFINNLMQKNVTLTDYPLQNKISLVLWHQRDTERLAMKIYDRQNENQNIENTASPVGKVAEDSRTGFSHTSYLLQEKFFYPVEKKRSINLAIHPGSHKEISSDQLHQRYTRNLDMKFYNQQNENPDFVYATTPARTTMAKDRLDLQSGSQADMHNTSKMALHPTAGYVKPGNILPQQNQHKPIQLNRDEITNVADQVARVLEHRKRFERERRGGFY